MPINREITWPGFYNARDLGGLPTADGRRTARRAFIRSADLRFVTADGWRAARDAGIRTVVDLRNDYEIYAPAEPVTSDPVGLLPFAAAAVVSGLPPGMTWLHVPLDGIEDVAFWQYVSEEGLNGSPLYYPPFLERKADRCAAAITAIARSAPGGVLFHCGAGRDRTGLVSLLLLALAGVAPDVIADDYALSTEALAPLFARTGREDEGPLIDQLLTQRGTTVTQAILNTLDDFDCTQYLLATGVTPEDLESLRTRLIS